jgi:hypothetical protein
VLSALQYRVAAILTGLSEAEDFVLAGGAALIARGDIDRLTRDLDYFATEPGHVDRLLPVLEAALHGAGLVVERRQVAPGFARLIVEGEGDRTEVDLASDARLLPPEPSRYGPALSGEELAVDKVLAVFGRAEARDFADLAVLVPRYGLVRLCRLAGEKDGGFRPAALREMLDRFDRLPRDEFDVDDAGFERLRAALSWWRDELDRDLEQQSGSSAGEAGSGPQR